jgi:hypothetical protein
MNLNITSEISLNQEKEKKILLEKRKRYQVYTLLDHLLTNLSYFDYFSSDTFKVLIYSKYLAEIAEKEIIDTEMLLIPFFGSDLNISLFLKNSNLNESEIGLFISSLQKLKKKSLNDKKDFYFKKFYNFIAGLESSSLQKKIKYSHEATLFFEKVSENAIYRFKTPVISPEIFFITLMEEKQTKGGKLIKKFIKTDTEWYLLRYKLIKQLHSQELNVRNEVKKNEQYFAYLLKSYLSEYEFSRLVETNSLSFAVSLFRNKIISDLLAFDLLDILYKEVNQSIKLTNKRRYSS